MSSRNRYLDDGERAPAPQIYRCAAAAAAQRLRPASATSPRSRRRARRCWPRPACRSTISRCATPTTCCRRSAGTRELVRADGRAPGRRAAHRQPQVALRCCAAASAPRRTCSRTSAEASSRARARSARMRASHCAARCPAPRRCCAASARGRCGGSPSPAVALRTAPRVQPNSSTRRGASRPWRTLKSGCAAARANLFHGHTSWQSSQP